MGDYFQSTNINAGKYYLNGKPLNTSGDVPHTMLPAGSIIMWNGSNIPPGWHLCNGHNGTPNLSGRFVISVGTFTDQNGTSYHKSPGDKGGDFKIKNENLPEHTHEISPNYLFNGTTSSIYAVNAGTPATALAFSGSPSTKPNTTTNEPYYPPYYALCYIMFTGQ